MNKRAHRRQFLDRLLAGVGVVWPILSGLVGVIALLGLVIGAMENWSLHESLYFSFVTGLTIGFGDFAPKTVLGRALAVVIGLTGILLTALVAAVAVKALGGTDGE